MMPLTKLMVVMITWTMLVTIGVGAPPSSSTQEPSNGLRIEWHDNYLTIRGAQLPRGPMRIHYLEAYCRADSHRTDWVRHTVVGHTTKLIEADPSGKRLVLQCRVNDGVVVDHVITAKADEIDFQLRAHNPTEKRSEAHWAQPCIRVGQFTGHGPDDTKDAYAYVPKCFVVVDGKQRRLPTEPWALEARYTPGQVWRGPGIKADDVNPRPLSELNPSHGLMGCIRHDDQVIMAVAFSPYQELFQGVIRCIHNDFRLGGLEPGETLEVRGKIYFVPNDFDALLARYEKDFGQD